MNDPAVAQPSAPLDRIGAPPPDASKPEAGAAAPLRRPIELLLDAGYVDAFRALHPTDDGFTLPTDHPAYDGDMVRTEALVDAMGAAARDYDRVGPAVFVPIAQRLVDFVGVPEAGSVLDVGTGPGIVLAEVAGRAAQPMHLVGIDLSDAMLAEAARRTDHLRDRGHRIELHRMDALKLDVESDTFDLVFCASTLYQLAEPAAACREFWRVLRSGGSVGIAVFGEPDPRWRGKNELLAQLAPPMPPVGRRLDEVVLRRLLDAAAFIDIEILTDQLNVAFDDAEAWLAQAWTHGERRALAAMNDVALRRFRRELPRALQPAREDDDKLHWHPQVILARARKP